MLFAGNIFGQEFLSNITVNSQQVEGTDKRVYENMQTALQEFINNRIWTNYDFKASERIECNFLLTIVERPETDRFKATLNVVASRPVFKSAYNSPLMNYIDKDVEFFYVEFQPMEFQENTYNDNLTSIISYYLYMILALDFDSFSLQGGSQFFEKAESIVNAAQNSGEKGWGSFEDPDNRYWLLENYMNNSYFKLRQFLYDYHRLGLDLMSEKADQGRSKISESLTYLQDVHNERPGLFALQLLIDAKRAEIINIFSEGNPREKSDAENIMKEIDPANSSEYSKITRN
jgi:hypothetical protein